MIKIIVDSSCDIELDNTSKYIIEKVPFIISSEQKDYIDEGLNVEAMFSEIDSVPGKVTTSCPSIGKFYDKINGCDGYVLITISQKLSGSYNAAYKAMEMALEDGVKNIHVIDSKSAGSKLSMLVIKLTELINMGLEFDEIVEEIEKYNKTVNTIFALKSFKNLARNGRIKKATAFLAMVLGIFGIGEEDDGEIKMVKKVKGKRLLLHDLANVISSKVGGAKEIIITHCLNSELANMLKEKLESLIEGVKVKVLETKGLCSFYAENGGLIIGY